MARISTPGIWLPGKLNTISSPSPTAQQDFAGNPYFMGLNPGKMIVLGSNEAQSAAAPGSTLYDGSYQYVKLDSGATAAYAVQGCAAFLLLDNGGAPQGQQPQGGYTGLTVTTADVAEALYGSVALANAFFCGVFINPTNADGVDFTPTPGDWLEIFVGAGRVQVLTGSVAALVLGQSVFPDTNHVGAFESTANKPVTPGVAGVCVTAATSTHLGVTYYPDIIYRFPN